ncbi:fatty acid desaturase family protein [bacterium]|nr:fatty acid desaturase family protein [bacterium]
MERYNNNRIYSKISLIVSIFIIGLQVAAVVGVFQLWRDTSLVNLMVSFVCAYIITDFINGLVHLYMDNNTNYRSTFGPFIAAFHFHHLKPRYTERHPLIVYFFESGTKFWLVLYLLILVWMQNQFQMRFEIQFCLTCIGVLSSFAEVSHYWCHNTKDQKTCVNFLQKHGVLLSKKHHMVHHLSDNRNYAFLNGISDPIINIIAHYFYDGYKKNADQHVRSYTGKQTANRT